MSEATLSAPVGPGQPNAPADMKTVRALLNSVIDQGFLIPLANLPADGGWDDRVTYALSQVVRRYFFGVADPNGKLETTDSLFQFLVHADDLDLIIGGRLSNEMLELAGKMVPGGKDVIKKIPIKVNEVVNGKPHVKKVEELMIQFGNIRKFLPDILRALTAEGLDDTDMVMMALATIRAETSGFAPIDEGISHLNTSPVGTKDRHAFDLYDFRNDLGNNHTGDGALYKGRGFVQLTGHDNYAHIGPQVGVDLLRNPDLADQSDIAAKILAQFLKNHEVDIRSALKDNNLRRARRLVNGGSNGLQEFEDAFAAGRKYLGIVIAAKAKTTSKPKTVKTGTP